MKKIILILLCLIITSVLLISYIINNSNSKIRTDYPYYESEQELINNSDVIVVGRITKNDERKLNVSNEKIHNVEYTISDVKIEDVIKGDFNKGDVLKVKQLGNSNNPNIDVRKYSYFKSNKEYLFFLKKFNSDTPYSTLNPQQGHLNIDGNKIIPNKGDVIHNMEDKLNTDSLKANVDSQSAEGVFDKSKLIERIKLRVNK